MENMQNKYSFNGLNNKNDYIISHTSPVGFYNNNINNNISKNIDNGLSSTKKFTADEYFDNLMNTIKNSKNKNINIDNNDNFNDFIQKERYNLNQSNEEFK